MFSPEQARDVFKEILKRDEFLWEEPGGLEGILHELASTLSLLLETYGLNAFLLLGFIATVSVFILVVWLLRRHRFPLERDTLVASASNQVNTPATSLNLSLELAHSGNHQEALRYLVHSLLLQLDEKGVLNYYPWQTNGEILNLLKQQSFSGYQAAVQLFYLFENVWYGRWHCRKEEFEQGKQLYFKIQETLP